VGSRAGLNDVKRRKFCPYWDFNSTPSAIQPVASFYIDYAVLAPTLLLYNKIIEGYPSSQLYTILHPTFNKACISVWSKALYDILIECYKLLVTN
jgi:hypothetical protein